MSARDRLGLYAPIEPYRRDRLAVPGGHDLYFEESGNRNGKPVLIVHGGGDLPTILRTSLEGHVPAWLLPVAVRLARIPTDSFDPVRYVDRIAPRELVVVAARHDRSFPPACVEAYFARAGEPKTLFWTETTHVGNQTPDIVAAVLELITAYIDAEPAPV